MGAKLMDTSHEAMAGEVLAHSEDENEWEEEPAEVESRPSGSQVVSVRLPTELAERLFEQAANRGVRPSELVRRAVEEFLDDSAARTFTKATGGAPGWPVRIITTNYDYLTENANLVVEQPWTVVTLGYQETA